MSDIPRNPLSCTRCKAKKIKCGREEPKCDQCSKVSNTECFYPARRQKIKTVKKKTDIVAHILQRLDTLERQVGVTSKRFSVGDDTTSQGGIDNSVVDQGGHGENDAATNSEGGRTENETPLKSLYQLMNEAASTTKNVLEEAPPDEASDEAADTLFHDTLASIRTFRWKDSKTTESSDKLDIPDDLAYKWIDLCFSNTFYEQIVGTPYKNLMKAMPEIMRSPAVQVHLSVVVTYYNVLYGGWRSDGNSAQPQYRDYGRQIYRECLKLLPTWKNDGHITTVDFIALGLMVIMSIENFDYQLAWDLHLACCGIARDLKLHQLDDVDPINRPEEYKTESERDVMRKKFWQLIHLEYFFRLYYDKPASMTMTDFSVNFPSITETTTATQTGETIYFLVNSRVVFITKEFFDVLEKPGPDFKVRVDSLIDQLENLLVEWNIGELLASSPNDSNNKWMYADLMINCYITVILMERKAYGKKGESYFPSTRSTISARNTLQAIISLSNLIGKQSPNFLGFISFYPFVAFFTLYHHILDSLKQRRTQGLFDPTSISQDIELMENLAGLLSEMAESQDEFRIVANAVTTLTKASRNMLATSLPPTPASAVATSAGQGKIRTRSTRSIASNNAAVVVDTPTALSITQPQTDFSFPWTSTEESTWPQLEAGFQQHGLQTPLLYVESMESDLFGKNWHQSWFDQ